MESGDVILSFDGTEVEDTRGLVRTVGNTEVGKTVRVVVLRDGATQTLKITLGRREEAERTLPAAQPRETPEAREKEILGLTLSVLSDEKREELSLPANSAGLLVLKVDETSEAYEKGLRENDLITEAGQQKVTDLSALDERISEAREAGRKSLLLLVRRGGEPRFVALSLDEG